MLVVRSHRVPWLGQEVTVMCVESQYGVDAGKRRCDAVWVTEAHQDEMIGAVRGERVLCMPGQFG